jgi:hypothetical protein
MNISIKIASFIISIPARIKGMKFGKNSVLSPGYDWMMAQLTNIDLKDNVWIGKNA